MENPERRWYVVKTKRYKEGYVQSQLEYAGIETYCPLARIPKQYLRKAQRQIEPFFPGYVFARFELPAQNFCLRRAHDVVSLVCFGGQPAWLDPDVIEQFRQRQNDQGYILFGSEEEPFHAQDRVRIVDGPFTGYTGLFVRYLDSSQRIRILLDFFRPQALLELPLSSVVAAVPASAAFGSGRTN